MLGWYWWIVIGCWGLCLCWGCCGSLFGWSWLDSCCCLSCLYNCCLYNCYCLDCYLYYSLTNTSSRRITITCPGWWTTTTTNGIISCYCYKHFCYYHSLDPLLFISPNTPSSMAPCSDSSSASSVSTAIDSFSTLNYLTTAYSIGYCLALTVKMLATCCLSNCY